MGDCSVAAFWGTLPGSIHFSPGSTRTVWLGVDVEKYCCFTGSKKANKTLGISNKPGLRGVITYSKLCSPSCLVRSFPEKANAGGPILKSEVGSIPGAGIAEKLPFPLRLKVSLMGSPRETRSESMEDFVANEPIAPWKWGGRRSVGGWRTSIQFFSDWTLMDSSLPKPKKGSLKKGLLKGEPRWFFVRTRMFVSKLKE